MIAPFFFQRGETITLFVEAVGASLADFANVNEVTGGIKPALNGRGVPPPTTPVAAIFSVATIAPIDNRGAGWSLTISSTDSALLAPGLYAGGVNITMKSGDVEKVDPFFVRIGQAV